MYLDNNILSDSIKTAIVDMGLGDFEVEIYRLTTRAGYEMVLSRRWQVPYTVVARNPAVAASWFRDQLEGLECDILESPAISTLLRAKDKEIEEMSQQLADLEKYKTFYEMQMALSVAHKDKAE